MTLRKRLPRPARLVFLIGALLLLAGPLAQRIGVSVLPQAPDALLNAGLVTILLGFLWQQYRLLRPISQSAMAHLYWLARFSPECSELTEMLRQPESAITWGKAYQLEASCMHAKKQRR
ncbi:hypothetical protein HAP94_07075 [Acidithiobacillus ferrivorans]|nr:hypothetical protein [Acidithiobacillus ferrivorans]